MDFKQTETRFKELKARFQGGSLSEAAFKTQLQDLIIQDKEGQWWMIGYETEHWYRYDGTKWVKANLLGDYLHKTITPKWISLVWIILGWAISWAISIAIFDAMDKNIDTTLRLAIGGALSGAIGGIITGVILYLEHVLPDWKSVFWIALAWTISSAVGWLYAIVISLTMGGLIAAIILREEKVLPDLNSIFLITLAWAVGSAVGGAIDGPLAENVGRIMGSAIGGAIGGTIGGLIMIWQIREGQTR